MDSSNKQQEYESSFEFVWVFMSVHSDSGARGAPSAVFSNLKKAENWIEKAGIEGNLYRFPIDSSLAEFNEPLHGSEPFILKHQDKKSRLYKSGIPYLGFTPHEHYFEHD